MAESSRQIVRQRLEAALDAAFDGLRARPLGPEAAELAQRCAEGIRACLGDLAGSPASAPALQEALVRLLFSHGDPEVTAALRDFAETLLLHLAEARDELLPGGGGRRDA